MKIALGIEYDGSRYSGWQRQRHASSVQAAVETALSRVADTPVTVLCAGRTDAGVHATGQVVHFETRVERPQRAWVLGVNANLPPAISVRWSRTVSDDFHARFSALSRTYRYIICNRTARPGLWAGKLGFVPYRLDANAMHDAAQTLLGEHDFSAFRAAGCQAKHPRRELTRITVERQGEFITLDVTANAFLQHMVRNIVGTLLEIGRGDKSVSWLNVVLHGRQRAAAGVTAAPDGLYLTHVAYPPRYALPDGDPVDHAVFALPVIPSARG